MKRLIGDLEPEMGKLIEEVRKNVLSTLKKKPTLEWLGLTMRWCETTTPPEGGKLMSVHIVPDPSIAKVVLMVSTAFFEQHSPAELPKSLHSGLELATTIGHRTWIELPVHSAEAARSVEAFIELVHDA